ncbi:Esterase/lipase [Chromobacterium violaceum]|nr:Esterase/lipase [Chromobacterium violaceum]
MPLSNSYHMVMVDNERAEVLQRSLKFFNSAPQPQLVEQACGWTAFAAA